MTNRNERRNARRAFQKTFSVPLQVLDLLVKGKPTSMVAEKTGYPVNSVRTVRGNLTRGAYAPFFTPASDNQFTGLLC